MSILITGAAGFIGSHLSDTLLKRGHHVIALDNFNDYYAKHLKRHNIEHNLDNDNYALIEADIRDKSAIKDLFKNRPIDTVIHLAARAGVRPSLEDPELYWDVNIMGTLNLLENMREHKVKRLIFASSSSVYGNREKGPFKESDNTDNQVSPYGASKKSGEVLVHTYAHLYGIKSTVLRFFTVYGPRNRPDMAHFKFMHAIMNDQPITQFGDGTTGRDYTYIEDTVDGIIKSLDLDSLYDIYNLGNSSPILLKDMIKTIEEVTGKTADIKPLPMQPGDVPLTYADITKAQKAFGYHPKTEYEEGVRKLFDWYQQNQQLFDKL